MYVIRYILPEHIPYVKDYFLEKVTILLERAVLFLEQQAQKIVLLKRTDRCTACSGLYKVGHWAELQISSRSLRVIFR